jgi:two-component system cell cycle sensor histidine kinase/response regulator CckA
VCDAVDLALEFVLGIIRFISHFQLVNGLGPDRVTHTLRAAVDSPSHTVLVVDDDAAIRFLCRVNLELDGWSVHEADAIERARETLAATAVDIVLLDVHVGIDSGLDFIAEIRERHPGLPVVLLTGSVGSPGLDGVDAEAVISKPFTLDQLTGTLGKLVLRTAPEAG